MNKMHDSAEEVGKTSTMPKAERKAILREAVKKRAAQIQETTQKES